MNESNQIQGQVSQQMLDDAAAYAEDNYEEVLSLSKVQAKMLLKFFGIDEAEQKLWDWLRFHDEEYLQSLQDPHNYCRVIMLERSASLIGTWKLLQMMKEKGSCNEAV